MDSCIGSNGVTKGCELERGRGGGEEREEGGERERGEREGGRERGGKERGGKERGGKREGGKREEGKKREGGGGGERGEKEGRGGKERGERERREGGERIKRKIGMCVSLNRMADTVHCPPLHTCQAPRKPPLCASLQTQHAPHTRKTDKPTPYWDYHLTQLPLLCVDPSLSLAQKCACV